MTTSRHAAILDEPGRRDATGGAPEGAAPAPMRLGAAGPPGASAAGERGWTHIADRVVEKIAARAVEEVARAGGVSRRVLGVRLSRDSADQDARTTARVDGGIVTVQVRMSVLYPSSVRQVAASVRGHVIDRVQQLTGLDVKYVDIEVARLLPAVERARSVR